MSKRTFIIVIVVLVLFFICAMSLNVSGLGAFEFDFDSLDDNPMQNVLVIPVRQSDWRIVSASACSLDDTLLTIQSSLVCQLRISASTLPLTRRATMRLESNGSVELTLLSEFEGEDITIHYSLLHDSEDSDSSSQNQLSFDIFPAGGTLRIQCITAPCTLTFLE